GEGDYFMQRVKDEFIYDGEFSNQNITFSALIAIEETGKMYGPIFMEMVSKFALEFEARRLNEKPPENTQGLNAVFNYIMANLDRYPYGFNSLIYGLVRTQKELEGSIAVASKRASKIAMKNILQSSGMVNDVIGTIQDPLEAMKKALEFEREAKTGVPGRYIKGENNELILIFSNCPFQDACKAFLEEGITRIVGGLECVILITGAAEIEVVTGKNFDYKLEKFLEPECRGIIFEI
ncbi:MAG: hypothetical protein QXO71_08895, partial [Candidatus Jordarchaeaceae archaeon]